MTFTLNGPRFFRRPFFLFPNQVARPFRTLEEGGAEAPRHDPQPAAVTKAKEAKASPAKATAKPKLDAAALKMLANAVTASADEDGRANLARVGAHLAKQSPDFDARNYGFARLTDLVEASGIVDVERSGDSPKIVTVRMKGKARPKPNG
jgi:hypothetical protein